MTEQKIEHLAKWHCLILTQNIQICRSVTFLRWESPEVHI